MQHPPSRPQDNPEDHLGSLQYAMLSLIATRPYWVVDRAFWRTMAHHLRVLPSKAKQVFQSLERGGHVTVSDRDDPLIVIATNRGGR